MRRLRGLPLLFLHSEKIRRGEKCCEQSRGGEGQRPKTAIAEKRLVRLFLKPGRVETMIVNDRQVVKAARCAIKRTEGQKNLD